MPNHKSNPNNTRDDSLIPEQLSSEHWSTVEWVPVSENDAGQRLDNFLLKRLKGVPKSKIYQIIRKGEVRIDKKRVKPLVKLREGQLIRVPPVRQPPNNDDLLDGHIKLQKNQDQIQAIEKAILYEDKHLLVLNKPSGLAVHGGSGISLGLIELLRASRPKDDFLELVHRLDRETSGCIVIAKRGPVLRELHQLIRDNKVKKHYQALLHGRWKGKQHVIEAALQKNTLKSGERVVRVSRDGKASKTIFTIKQHFKSATLVNAQLLTGRTHQIRVHSQFAGYPIIGDTKYGSAEASDTMLQTGLRRMFLHAFQLTLPLSCYDKPLAITAPLDESLRQCIQYLKGQQGND